MMQMHDAHGILHDARCDAHGTSVHQLARPARSQHPFHITKEIAQSIFATYLCSRLGSKGMALSSAFAND